jgi:hypothetical protein
MKKFIQQKTQSFLQNMLALTIVFSLTIMISCDNNEDLDADKEDNETTQLDALEDFYQEDTEDLSIEAMEANQLTGGRSAQNDHRLDCAVVTRTGDKAYGKITIDFGTGCTDARGNVRKGIIIITYTGRWNIPGSSWSITFENYSVNDISIEGTRVVTNISESEAGTQSFTVVLENGKMTWPDGSVATRTVNKKREVERDDNNILNRLIIYGSVQGSHRNGRGYSIEILEKLVYDRSCEDVIIPVSGIKQIKHGQREITVDYGDGTCDNIVTITNMNGRTWTYTVDKKH